jgi:hypothetical protein
MKLYIRRKQALTGNITLAGLHGYSRGIVIPSFFENDYERKTGSASQGK